MHRETRARIWANPWKPLTAGLVAGACLWVALALTAWRPLGLSLENMALDAAYRLRTLRVHPQGLLVVAVDEPSFQEIGLPWPWPRRLHAALLDRLTRAGARLVVMDMVFAEATTPADDQALAAALAASGRTVLARALETVDDPAFSRRVLVDPLPLLAERAAGLGLAVLTPDPDGAVRRFEPRLGNLPTLAGAALALLSPDGRVPETGGLIDYPGPARTIDTVSYAQVIDPDHPLPEAHIKGRVVVVGRSLAASAAPLGQADAFATPFTLSTGQQTAGPEIHAAIIDTMLRGRPGREVPGAVLLLAAGLLLPTAGVVLFSLRPLAAAGTALGLALGLTAASMALFVWQFVWFPPVLLAGSLVVAGGAATLYRGLAESREKRWLTRAFSRYVSPEVVRGLVARPERLELGGEEAEVTVFFSDLAGFTSFSEGLSPKALIGLLNEYFTPATDIILASGGTLDKFIGDAVMAFWGAPLPHAGHAAKALAAALSMSTALDALRRDFASRGLPEIRVRMGLHSGPAVVGNVGSRERFNYTILGDTVNLASRLESLNKHYGTEILVSGETRKQAGDGFVFREIDRVRVAGRTGAVTIHEPLGRGNDALPEFARLFAAARQRYQERDFAAALEGFAAADAARPNDPPSRVLAGRCRQYLETPPPPDWDEVFVPAGK